MIVSSKSGAEYARCLICARDIKVAASGVFDVRMHLGTSMHQSNEAKSRTYKPMTSFFGAKPHTSASVTKAEVLFCQFVAEHNLAASVSDHFTDLVKTMFANSAVAEQCLIQDKISTSPSPTDRRADVAPSPRRRRIGRYYYLIILPLLIILLSLKSNFIIL